MLVIDDDPAALQIAANLAIARKDLDLLRAAIAIGLNPRQKFHTSLVGPYYETPLEQAMVTDWNEGILLMAKTN